MPLLYNIRDGVTHAKDIILYSSSAGTLHKITCTYKTAVTINSIDPSCSSWDRVNTCVRTNNGGPTLNARLNIKHCKKAL